MTHQNSKKYMYQNSDKMRRRSDGSKMDKREQSEEIKRLTAEFLASGKEITVGKPCPEPVYTSYPARGW